MSGIAHLAHRGVVAVSGEDRVGFLQGLVSNDMRDAAPGRAVWAALLTPQGRWLHEFLVFDGGDRLLLACERDRAADLAQRLARFRLRAKVAVADASPGSVVAAGWGGAAMPPGAAPDPRHQDAGWVGVFAAGTEPAATASAAEWDAHRLGLGLPDGSRDLEAERTLLLEAWFDALGGVSWSKGCYIGQELTARTKYRGLVRKRLMPVAVEGALPPPGTPVFAGEAEVGTLRSGSGDRALAMLRTDALGGTLSAGGARLRPLTLPWMAVAEDAAR